jgi:predicted nucleic acid-binding protein
MQSIYIETTIPSYAVAKPSLDVLKVARQTLTIRFWENERQKYDLYTSQFTLDECARGDKIAAQKRLDFLRGLKILPNTVPIGNLAVIYQQILNIPERAKTDCYHLATCVAAQLDYLLSWNCTHLGIFAYAKILEYNNKNGLKTPLLVTPEAFGDGENL